MTYQAFLLKTAPFFFCAFAFSTTTFVFVGLLGPMSRDLGVSVSAVAQLQTAFSIACALFGPFLVQRLQRHHLELQLMGALSVLALSNVVCAVATDLPLMVLGRLVGGVSGGLILPLGLALAFRNTDGKDSRSTVAVITFGTTAAFLIGVPVGSYLGGELGWRTAFFYASALAVFALVLVVLSREPDRPGIAPTSQAAPVALQDARALFATVFLAFTAAFTTVSFIGPIVENLFRDPQTNPGLFQSVIGVGSLIGILLSSFALKLSSNRFRTGSLLLLVGVQLGYALLLLAMPSSMVASASLVLLTLTGSSLLFAIVVVVQSKLTELGGAGSTILLSWCTSALFLGQGLGSAVGGTALVHADLWLLGCVGAAIAACAFAIPWRTSTA